MRITTGPAPGAVLQVNPRRGAARTTMAGTCRGEGDVFASIDGRRFRRAGRAAGGRWQARVEDIPPGGPYRMVFHIGTPGREPCRTAPFHAGDLWVLAGQSNMAGAGAYVRPEPPVEPVRVYDKTERWRMAADPLDGGDRRKSTGLGVRFGKELFAQTGLPVGLIPCARGSSSMADWDPDGPGAGDPEPLYAAMLRRVRACGGRVRGLLWYQGESDATPAHAASYVQRFTALMERIRQDLGHSLPVIYVQIGRVLTFEDDPNLAEHRAESWDAIRGAQERLSHTLPCSEMTSAVDLELDNKIHHSSEALKRLGRRLALLALRRAHRVPSLQPGPRIARSVFRIVHGIPVVDVFFRGVNGALAAEGRPSGFRVFDTEDRENPVIKTHIRGARTVRLFLHRPETPHALYYGRGMDPYCNLRDALDLPLPATGPAGIDVGRSRR